MLKIIPIDQQLQSDFKKTSTDLNPNPIDAYKLYQDLLTNRNNLIDKCCDIFGINKDNASEYIGYTQKPNSLVNHNPLNANSYIDFGIVELFKKGSDQFLFGVDGFNNAYVSKSRLRKE